jgi:hypothetical protein
MKTGIVALLLMLVPALGSADILEWRSADGVRHFTNLKSEVPKDQRDATQIVVDEQTRHPEGTDAAATTAPPPAVAERQQPRKAEVVYDRSPVSAAYVEGLVRGLELARGAAAGGGVQINGPLVAGGGSSAVAPGDYLPDYYYPFVTTSFDRGRSRHLTLRMLLEDQFAIDREGPFVFADPFVPARLGPALAPFLPRGLPHGFPPDGRVIIR